MDVISDKLIDLCDQSIGIKCWQDEQRDALEFMEIVWHFFRVSFSFYIVLFFDCDIWLYDSKTYKCKKKSSAVCVKRNFMWRRCCLMLWSRLGMTVDGSRMQHRHLVCETDVAPSISRSPRLRCYCWLSNAFRSPRDITGHRYLSKFTLFTDGWISWWSHAWIFPF